MRRSASAGRLGEKLIREGKIIMAVEAGPSLLMTTGEFYDS